MVTTVGLERDVRQMLERLMVLDFDAIEAYRLAVAECRSERLREALRGFQRDHERHARELAPLVEQLGGTPPAGSEVTELFTTGKVLLAQPFGDHAVLAAMLVNEADTNGAYALAVVHDNLPTAVRPVLERGLEDEKRHRRWLQQELIAPWWPAAFVAPASGRQAAQRRSG